MRIRRLIGIVRLALVVWALLVLPAVLPIHAQEMTPTPQINAAITGLVDAQFITNNNTPYLGEPVMLEIVITAPQTISITEWPTFPDEDEVFAVLNTGDIVQTNNDDNITYRQALEIVLWQTGTHLTPEIAVLYENNGAILADPVRSVAFTVQSLLEPETPPDNETDETNESDGVSDTPTYTLRPNAPSIDMPYTPPALIIGLIALVIVILSGIIWLLRRGGRRAGRAMRGTPEQIAMAELQDLGMQDLAADALYPLVANRLRLYLQERFDIRAVELTTAELDNILRQRDYLSADLRQRLQQILSQADLVKFARFEPDAGSNRRLVHASVQWLRDAAHHRSEHSDEETRNESDAANA